MTRYNVTASCRSRATALVCALALGGCVAEGGPATSGAPPAALPPPEGIPLTGNYQALVQCWQQETARQTASSGNRAQVRVDEDQNFAEIMVPLRGNVAAARLQLRRAGPRRTTATAYAASSTGERQVREWLEVLKACQARMGSDG